MKALRRIKSLLPLQPRLEYMKGCGDVAFSYREVETGLLGGGHLSQMPRYISWDNVIDMFLTRQPIAPTYQVVSNSQ